MAEAAARLGHDFARLDLFMEALTHPSTAGRPHNQRLEFLGDRVLGLVIAEALIAQDAAAEEGQLAPRLNALVRKETCAEVAAEIGLGDVLKLGRSEMMTGGRRKAALLGDAMEAVIAAVYLDGGFDAARTLVLRLWGDRIDGASDMRADAKTRLQEWAQARGEQPPVYAVVSTDGPPHQPVFTVRVTLADGASELARAGVKRQAEQAAAAALLARLEAKNG
jgi:ribonuclease-3